MRSEEVGGELHDRFELIEVSNRTAMFPALD